MWSSEPCHTKAHPRGGGNPWAALHDLKPSVVSLHGPRHSDYVSLYSSASASQVLGLQTYDATPTLIWLLWPFTLLFFLRPGSLCSLLPLQCPGSTFPGVNI